MLLNSVVLTGFREVFIFPNKRQRVTHFGEAHSRLTPNDSTSNFQQRPNNPIPATTTIIILWVLKESSGLLECPISQGPSKAAKAT
jgi:hypothetical protein